MPHQSFAFETNLRFAGFLNAPHAAAAPEARFGVAGIAWDGAVTNRPGARFGPSHIRRASHMLCDGIHPFWDVAFAAGELADHGDLSLPNTSLEAMREALQPEARRLLARQHMLWLGGDHSVTLPLLRAYREQAGEPLALLHFDAHCDTWSDHFGEPSGHGTWTYEAITEGLVDPRAVVQVGIRSAAARSAREFVNERGGRSFGARDLRGLESAQQLAAVIAEVRQRMGSRPAYLTLDIDCLDPAFAPGTGTPEPGGLTTNQVLSLLENLADVNWLGMDLCEVAPAYDHAELTCSAAASFGWTYLSGALAKARRLSAPSTP